MRVECFKLSAELQLKCYPQLLKHKYVYIQSSDVRWIDNIIAFRMYKAFDVTREPSKHRNTLYILNIQVCDK